MLLFAKQGPSSYTMMEMSPKMFDRFVENRIDKYCSDASTMGLEPGIFPLKFSVKGFGNGLPFVFKRYDKDGNAIYLQELGCVEIYVYNS